MNYKNKCHRFLKTAIRKINKNFFKNADFFLDISSHHFFVGFSFLV